MLLEPMCPGRLQVYLERLIPEYAEDKVLAGNWPPQVALAKSREEVSRFLPQGAATPRHALFDLTVPGEPEAVGFLWLLVVEDSGDRRGFIYDV